MALTGVDRGEQAARQAAQGQRAQAASLRRGDALARERFSLDRQDQLRAQDARERTRQDAAAKTQTLPRENRAVGPSQDRGTASEPPKAKETSSPARATTGAVRTGEAGKAQAADSETGPRLEAAGPAAPEATDGTEAGTAAADGIERAEAVPDGAPGAATAMPTQSAPPVAGTAPRHATGPAAEDAHTAPETTGDGSGPAKGERSGRTEDGAAPAAAGPASAGPVSDPAAGIAAKGAGTGDGTGTGTGFTAALAEAAASAALDTAAPSATVAPPDKAAASSAAVPSSAHPGTLAGTLAGTPPADPPVPLAAVPMTIGLRSMVGTNRFEMRLDPAELGRIDVTLDIDKDSGGVSATLVVDNPATLALLRRDADSLQQALAQAGFSAGEAGISLQLRGGDASQGQSRGEADRPDAGRPQAAGARSDAAPLDMPPLRALRPVGGLDIRI